MTASDIERLRELHLLPDAARDFVMRLPPPDPALGGRKYTGVDYEHWCLYLTANAAINALAAVAVEQAERAEASCDVQFKGAAKVQRIRAEQAEQALTADKARADKAEAMLTVAFDTYQAGVENGGYWEHCTYTQWLADLARRRLADLARRSQEKP